MSQKSFYVPPWKKGGGGNRNNRNKGKRSNEFTPPEKPPVKIDRILKCKVTRLLDFGYFAEIVTKSKKKVGQSRKVSGLCHVKNIVGKPRVDDIVFVKVINVRYNLKRGRWDIGFTMKNINQKTGKLINPELEKKNREDGSGRPNRRRIREDPTKPPVPVNTIAKGKVVSFKEFGFFCDFVEIVSHPDKSDSGGDEKELKTKISGLCHKSKMTNQDIEMNDMVFVRVNKVLWNEFKSKWDISLTMKYVNQETGEWKKKEDLEDDNGTKMKLSRESWGISRKELSDDEIEERKPKFKIGDVVPCLVKEFNNLGFFGEIEQTGKIQKGEEEKEKEKGKEEEEEEEEGEITKIILRGLCPYNQVFGNPQVGKKVFTKIHKIVWKDHRQKWEVFISMKHVDQVTGEVLKPSYSGGSGGEKKGGRLKGHYPFHFRGRRHKEEFRKLYPEICRKRHCNLDYCRRFHPWSWFKDNVLELKELKEGEERDPLYEICLETKKKLEESKQEVCENEKIGPVCECSKFHIVEDFYKPVRQKFCERSFEYLKKKKKEPSQVREEKEEEEEGEGEGSKKEQQHFTIEDYRSFEMFSTNPVLFTVRKKDGKKKEDEEDEYDVFVLIGLERERRKNLGIKKGVEDGSELGHLKMSFSHISGKFEIVPRHVVLKDSKSDNTCDKDVLDCTLRILKRQNIEPLDEEMGHKDHTMDNKVVFFSTPIYKVLVSGCHIFLVPLEDFDIEEKIKPVLMKTENEEGKWVRRSNFTWLKVDEEFFTNMKEKIVSIPKKLKQQEEEEEEEELEKEEEEEEEGEEGEKKKKKLAAQSQKYLWTYKMKNPELSDQVFEVDNTRKYQYEYNKKVILGEHKFMFHRGDIQWKDGDLEKAKENREENDFNGVIEKERNGSYTVSDSSLIQILAFEKELRNAAKNGFSKDQEGMMFHYKV